MPQAGEQRAVFVDPTGRRHRHVARTAWVLAGAGVAYVALVLVSLLLPPSLSRLTVPGLGPVLPGPAAAPLGQAEGEAERPEVLLERTPSSSPTPASRRSPSRAPGTLSSPTALASRPPSPALPTATASTAPTRATPAPPGRATAGPTEPPGQSAPPGQVSRTPKPRPTPSRGPR